VVTDPDHDFQFDLLEQWSDTVVFHATREHIAAFAAATNDDHPVHASGDFALPVYAVVPVFATMARTTMAVVPSELQMRILHGEQEMRYARQIAAGDELHCRAKVVGIHGRSSGAVVTTYVETTDGHGVEAPGHQLDPSLRERDFDNEVVQSFDDDQTYRYADASGDTMPIHTDPEFAQSVGLPGIIIHGLCTMAFVSRAAVQTACPEDPFRLKRLAVRFSAPAFPGSTITTRLWKTDKGTYAFETTSQDGSVVIKDGVVQVSD
jgi:acyl dehydratase